MSVFTIPDLGQFGSPGPPGPPGTAGAAVAARGSLQLTGGAVAVGLTATGFQKLPIFAVAAPGAFGVTADPANDRLTIGIAGTYFVLWQISVQTPLGGNVDTQVFRNGVPLAGTGARWVSFFTGFNTTASAGGFAALSAGDVLELFASPAAAQTFTFAEAALTARREEA